MRMRLFLALGATFLLGSTSFAQDAGGGPPGEGPRARMQYKRMHQHALRLIEQDKVDESIEHLLEVQKRLPEDAETQFMLTAAYAQAKKKDEALAAMKKALDLGLPPERFVAGPRWLFVTIEDEEAFKAVVSKHENEILHGPMIGNLTHESATVWARTYAKAATLVVSTDPNDATKMVNLSPVLLNGANDGTFSLTAGKLKADTEYFYSVMSMNTQKEELQWYRFRTAPAPGSKQKLTLAFGGGAGFQPKLEYMWDTIGAKKPDLLLMLGDNVYIDDPESKAMNHYTYYRRQSRPEWRKLIATTPVYSIWDDHDFATNDSWGGPEIDKPAWKQQVWDIFKQNWANPPSGGGHTEPGCCYDFTVGDVQFIMLDCRFYRTTPRKENPTMLGPVQKQWLFDTLKKSKENKATFRVLCSSVPWVFEAKGDSLDTWNGYKDERNEIFDFLTREKIEGIVLMSADRHRSDLWKIQRDGAYPLYEFNSSRLTNDHVHGEMKEAIFSYNKKQSFGLVTFDSTVADPTVTYKVISIDGEEIHSFTAKRSELK